MLCKYCIRPTVTISYRWDYFDRLTVWMHDLAYKAHVHCAVALRELACRASQAK